MTLLLFLEASCCINLMVPVTLIPSHVLCLGLSDRVSDAGQHVSEKSTERVTWLAGTPSASASSGVHERSLPQALTSKCCDSPAAASRLPAAAPAAPAPAAG